MTTRRDLVVIGASAGGIEALRTLVHGLPKDLSAAICIVVHLPAEGKSHLAAILARAGALPAIQPGSGDRLHYGHIYVAPPDHHLIVRRHQVIVSRGPRENRQRPSVDVLFRSAARAYGTRVIGVILSGSLDDGTTGMMSIRGFGGLGIVQDPNEALFPSMPRSAIERAMVDEILPVGEIADRLVTLTSRLDDSAGEQFVMPDDEREPTSLDGSEASNGTNHLINIHTIDWEIALAEGKVPAGPEPPPATPSEFACPDCGGSLWEIKEGDHFRFRCRVGHAFTAQSLFGEMDERIEQAMWVALRALDERSALSQRLENRARASGHNVAAERFAENVRESADHASVIRNALGSVKTPGTADVEATAAS